jgi:hypothetical protein
LSASNKQSELVKKLTAAWEKKNTKAARAGGASLMALSLAACGGDDDTPFSQADIDLALTDTSGTAHATVDAAITSNDVAIAAAVDITSDNADVAAAATAAAIAADTTLFDQDDVDAASAAALIAGAASVDITSDNDAASAAGFIAGAASVDITSDNADVAAAAAAAVDITTDNADVAAAAAAAVDITTDNAAAVTAALTDANGVVHADVDAAIASNDAAVALAVDLTTDNAAATDAAVAAATDFTSLDDLVAAYTGLTTPSSNTLTANQDIVNLTSANDTITGTSATLANGQGDVIVDSSATDNDTLTINGAALAVGIDTTGNTISNIETINIVWDSLTQSTANMAGVTTASTITLSQIRAGSGADFVVTNVSGGSTIVAGTNSSQIVATADLNGNLTMDGGSAATLISGTVSGTGEVEVTTSGTVTATAVSAAAGTTTINATGATTINATGDTIGVTDAGTTATTINLTGVGTDVATITSAGTGTTASIINTANAVETLNVSGSAELAATLTGTAATTINLTGDQNVTLSADDALLTGVIINDNSSATSTVTIGDGAGAGTMGATVNAFRMSVDNINLDDTGAAGVALNIAPSATVTMSRDLGQTLTLDVDDNSTADVNSTLNLTLAADITSTVANAAAGTDDIQDINLNNTVAQSALDLQANATTDIAHSGSANTVFANTSTWNSLVSTSSGQTTVTAAATSDNITLGAGNDTANLTTYTDAVVNTGGGNDNITIGANTLTATAVVNGGTGTNTLTVGGAADLTLGAVSNINIIAQGANTVSINDTAIHESAMVITGTGAITVTDIDASAVNLSNLSFTSTAAMTVNATANLDATSLGTNTSFTLTGSSNVDNLTGNAGADVIIGGDGIDVLTGNAGNDTIQGDAGGDTIVGGDGADNLTGGEGGDAITGGNGVDTIVLTETTAAVDTVTVQLADTGDGDHISSFVNGAGGDVFDLDGSTLTDGAATGVTTDDGVDDVNAAATSIAATHAALTVVGDAVYVFTTDIGGTTDFTTSTDAQIVTAIEAALEETTANVLSGTAGNAVTQGAINTIELLAFTDGTNTALVHYAEGAASEADYAGELSVLAVLESNTITTLTDANFFA